MKKFLLPIVVLALVSFAVLETGLTDAEREMAVEELTKTRDRLLNVVDGLSVDQLNFKPNTESWSVAECVEHLAISEGMIGGMLQGALQTPAEPAMRDSVQFSDDKLIGMISSRDQKMKTQEAFEPSGKFGTYEETLNAFMNKREEHIKYLKTTEDDLRNHYAQLPLGTIDGFQILLFMSGHTERHVKQIEEVIANENFPKK